MVKAKKPAHATVPLSYGLCIHHMNNSGIDREGFAREKVTYHKGSSRSQLGSPVRKVFKKNY